MKVHHTNRFEAQYKNLSPEQKAKADKQIGFLVENLRHPSLRAKKHDEANEANDIWQARVDRNYRFYFQIKGDHLHSSVGDPTPKVGERVP